MQQGVSPISVQTKDSVQTQFHLPEGGKCFHHSLKFPNQSGFCDVYFETEEEKVNQNQIDTFNYFIENNATYTSGINSFIVENLSSRQQDKIRFSPLLFDVLEVCIHPTHCDLVLIVSKCYRSLFRRRCISVRVEFMNGKIVSMGLCS